MVEPFKDCGFYAEYGPLAHMAFAKDGTLYVTFVASDFLNRARNATPRHVFLARSTDSGRSFTTTKVFDAPDGNQDRGLNKGAMVAVDPDDAQQVYVSWRQGVFAADAEEKLKSVVASTGDGGDLDVFVRVSDDAGRTWSDRITLSDETVKANQYEPGISIAPNASVHVAWYDFRHSPTDPLVSTCHSGDTGISDVYYTSSSDRGTTWARPVRVNDRGIDRSRGVWSNNIDSKFNVGVAATDTAVHFAWQDTRNALGETGSEDIYTSSVPLAAQTSMDGGSDIPAWTLLLTGVFGLGLGVAVAWLLMRRRGGAAPEPVPRGMPSGA